MSHFYFNLGQIFCGLGLCLLHLFSLIYFHLKTVWPILNEILKKVNVIIRKKFCYFAIKFFLYFDFIVQGGGSGGGRVGEMGEVRKKK